MEEGMWYCTKCCEVWSEQQEHLAYEHARLTSHDVGWFVRKETAKAPTDGGR